MEKEEPVGERKKKRKKKRRRGFGEAVNEKITRGHAC